MTLEKLLAISTLALTTSAHAQLYDDFSSGTIDPSRWEIRQDLEGQPLTESYGVQDGVFYAQNTNNPDRRTILALTGHSFQPGESLQYDVNYVSGSGNRAMVIFVDNGPLDRAVAPLLGGGSIGYNNGDLAAGNLFGQYHVRLDFFNDGLGLTIDRPDATQYTEFIPSTTWSYGGADHHLTPPYNVGFETWSNGSVLAEYDNFSIIPSAPTLIPLALGLSARRRRKD